MLLMGTTMSFIFASRSTFKSSSATRLRQCHRYRHSKPRTTLITPNWIDAMSRIHYQRWLPSQWICDIASIRSDIIGIYKYAPNMTPSTRRQYYWREMEYWIFRVSRIGSTVLFACIKMSIISMNEWSGDLMAEPKTLNIYQPFVHRVGWSPPRIDIA